MIVGKHTFGAYSNRLRKMSGASVIFTGLVSDEELPYYYAACDVYATCTLWEGFDLPVAEAQACGKPVVAFDIGPHKEVIDSRGCLVKLGDMKEFGKAVAAILDRVEGRKDGQ
jgi:1,2-diacylglycerol 3-alpha-glucosyltransferase